VNHDDATGAISEGGIFGRLSVAAQRVWPRRRSCQWLAPQNVFEICSYLRPVESELVITSTSQCLLNRNRDIQPAQAVDNQRRTCLFPTYPTIPQKIGLSEGK
jgi:hypothetical protein